MSEKKRCPLETIEIAKNILRVLDEKKGENILLLDIKDVSTFTSYFILCNGTSPRMLDSLADATLDYCRRSHRGKVLIDGHADGGWIVLDLGEIVVHIFGKEQRNFYDLEELWSNGKILVHLN